MQRISGATATKDGKFTEGDAVNNVEPTIVTSDFLNSIQEEICSIIEDEKISLDLSNNKQLCIAICNKINRALEKAKMYTENSIENFVSKNHLDNNLNNYVKTSDLNNHLKEYNKQNTELLEFMRWTIHWLENILNIKYPNYLKDIKIKSENNKD